MIGEPGCAVPLSGPIGRFQIILHVGVQQHVGCPLYRIADVHSGDDAPKRFVGFRVDERRVEISQGPHRAAPRRRSASWRSGVAEVPEMVEQRGVGRSWTEA